MALFIYTEIDRAYRKRAYDAADAAAHGARAAVKERAKVEIVDHCTRRGFVYRRVLELNKETAVQTALLHQNVLKRSADLRMRAAVTLTTRAVCEATPYAEDEMALSCVVRFKLFGRRCNLTLTHDACTRRWRVSRTLPSAFGKPCLPNAKTTAAFEERRSPVRRLNRDERERS